MKSVSFLIWNLDIFHTHLINLLIISVSFEHSSWFMIRHHQLSNCLNERLLIWLTDAWSGHMIPQTLTLVLPFFLVSIQYSPTTSSEPSRLTADATPAPNPYRKPNTCMTTSPCLQSLLSVSSYFLHITSWKWFAHIIRFLFPSLHFFLGLSSCWLSLDHADVCVMFNKSLGFPVTAVSLSSTTTRSAHSLGAAKKLLQPLFHPGVIVLPSFRFTYFYTQFEALRTLQKFN